MGSSICAVMHDCKRQANSEKLLPPWSPLMDSDLLSVTPRALEETPADVIC